MWMACFGIGASAFAAAQVGEEGIAIFVHDGSGRRPPQPRGTGRDHHDERLPARERKKKGRHGVKYNPKMTPRRRVRRLTFLSSFPSAVVAGPEQAGISTWACRSFALRANNLQRLPWHRRASPSATLDKSLERTCHNAGWADGVNGFFAGGRVAVRQPEPVRPLLRGSPDRRAWWRAAGFPRCARPWPLFHDPAALAETQRPLAGGEPLERRVAYAGHASSGAHDVDHGGVRMHGAGRRAVGLTRLPRGLRSSKRGFGDAASALRSARRMARRRSASRRCGCR